MAGYSSHSRADGQDSLARHGRPPYVYRALREGEPTDHNSVCLKAKGEVKEATPSLKTIRMAVEEGLGASPFIHTTTSPTAALWFARSSVAFRSSRTIVKLDLRGFDGRVDDLSQGQFLEARSTAYNFARCFSEVLLQGPPGPSGQLWNGILTEDQIRVVHVWDVSEVQVPRAKKFGEFKAELWQFPRVNDLLDEMERTNLHDTTMPYTGGAGLGVPFVSRSHLAPVQDFTDFTH